MRSACDDRIGPLPVVLGSDPAALGEVRVLGAEDPAEPASDHGTPSYQFVAVEVSISPTDASQRSASMAALQPSPAAVTAWR